MARILIVDDDRTVRDLFLRAIMTDGYEGAGAANGREARRLLDAAEFDLVITDIIMPGEEGLETIAFLRKSRPDVPVIAVSGGARVGPETYLDIARRMGARFTFRKPVDLCELLDAIHVCFEDAS